MLVELESARIQLIVRAFFLDQIVVVATLDDPALFEDHDRVRVLDRRQTMRDDEHRTARHQLVHPFLNDPFGTGIDRRSRFIEDEDRRIGNRGPRDRKQLTLSLGKRFARTRNVSIVAVLEMADKFIGIGQLGCRDTFLVGRVQLAKPDIVHDRSREQVRVLKNDTKTSAKIRLFDQFDIDPVVRDRAFLDLVKTVDQIRDGCLACAGRAHERDLLSWLGKQRNIMQDHFLLCIAERHIVEAYVAFQFDKLHFSVRTRMSPAPVSGVFRTFDPFAVFLFHVDKRDDTVIGLARLVEDRIDAGRSRQP